MGEGSDLEIIKKRMLLEMQRKMLEKELKKAEPDYYSIFLKYLTDDGRIMFEKAVEQYSDTAKKIGEKLGKLFYSGRLREKLNAEAVYWIFYEIGLPIRLETKIVYKKGREYKSISDVLKEE
ncbi:hypothetical protein MA03_00015 [Infirmifilum uzonense]|uniref:Uncharacterized protein n=1 Tax=Infirmifilum uzonense TaxID=1550241 RepID=A0A0F7FFT4_9CREN|nr:hypothetical protein [Infirmifilum uzonense]AKG38005.1 hypothetical protein MA03_00015 [Infirmifilum uzonense]